MRVMLAAGRKVALIPTLGPTPRSAERLPRPTPTRTHTARPKEVKSAIAQVAEMKPGRISPAERFLPPSPVSPHPISLELKLSDVAQLDPNRPPSCLVQALDPARAAAYLVQTTYRRRRAARLEVPATSLVGTAKSGVHPICREEIARLEALATFLAAIVTSTVPATSRLAGPPIVAAAALATSRALEVEVGVIAVEVEVTIQGEQVGSPTASPVLEEVEVPLEVGVMTAERGRALAIQEVKDSRAEVTPVQAQEAGVTLAATLAAEVEATREARHTMKEIPPAQTRQQGALAPFREVSKGRPSRPARRATIFACRPICFREEVPARPPRLRRA